MRAIIEFFTRNRLFGDLLTIFIIFAGIFATLSIQREVFPNVSFDVISIVTIYPGASPEESEKLITNRIEQDLKEVDGIKRIQSFSIDNRSSVVVFLDPDQTTEAKAKADIKDIIDLIDFPAEAEDPLVVAVESKQTPIMEVAISSEMPEVDFRKLAKELEREIETVPGVAKIVHKGLRDLEIKVQPDPMLLLRYSVSLDELINALRLQNRTIPAGMIEPLDPSSGEKETLVRTIGEFKTLKDVEDTVIRANELGSPIRVRDIAQVIYGLEKSSVVNRTNGRPSLTLTVLKKEKADAIRVVDAVRAKVAEFETRFILAVDKNSPPQSTVSFSFINDLSEYIRRRVSILTTNLFVGLLLVIFTLALFLPFRSALIVGAGILISFFGCIFIFYLLGYSINLLSLLGLIIVCGMLVDDAIVVSDNVHRHMKKGGSKIDAAIQGAWEIWPAVTASVLTTVIAFLPMMFMSGIFGKFTKQIPLGVIIALIISLFEALWIIPQHMAHYGKVDNGLNPKGLAKVTLRFQKFWDNWLVPRYTTIIEKIIRKRYYAASGIFVFFIFTLFVAQTGLKFVLFPPEGVEIFFVRVKAPTGYSLKQTTEVIKPIEAEVAKLPKTEVQDFVTTVGVIQQDPNDPNTKRGSEYAQIAVYLTPETQRDRIALEVINDLREKIGKPATIEDITFDRVNPGPPMGKPVSLSVRGQNYDTIMAAVKTIKEKIKDYPGLMDLSDSYVTGKNELHVIVNKAEAAAAGVSVTQVGQTVRAALDGIIATTIPELEDEVSVRVSFSDADKTSASTLQQIKIPNQQGNLVPLTRVARVEKAQAIAVYQHENNEREVKVTAELDTNITSASETNNKIRDILPEIISQHPTVAISFGGEDEDTKESMQSLIRAFTLAFAGIFLLLILTFKNLLQPFLVILTIPLGIMSVIWTLFVARMPLSFMAMLGVIALAGVIVNNAIVLIDFVNQGRKEGLDRHASLIRAAQLRIKPIFLTSATTVMGLLPTAHGIGGLDKFVVPIAMSLGYGLMFGALLTAFFFPAAIAIIDDIQEIFERRFSKKAN